MKYIRKFAMMALIVLALLVTAKAALGQHTPFHQGAFANGAFGLPDNFDPNGANNGPFINFFGTNISLQDLRNPTPVQPDLAITQIRLGTSISDLQVYNVPRQFNPQDDIVIELTLQNTLNDSSLAAALGDIIVAMTSGLPNFPQMADEDPFILLAQEEKTVLITYHLPATTPRGDYTITFQASGQDINGNVHSSRKTINLEVVAETNIAEVITLSTSAPATVSCEEQQNPVTVTATIANIGANSVPVRVNFLEGNTVLDSTVVTVPAGTQRQADLALDLSDKTAGTYSFLVQARNNVVPSLVYGEETFSLTITACPALSFTASSPAAVLRDQQATFGVVVSNTPTPLNLVWKVDNVVVQQGNTMTYSLDAQQYTVGTHVITVSLGSQQISRNLQISDRPIDIDTFSGTATTTLDQIQDVTSISNFVLENAAGKIAFTQPVDLSDILLLSDVAVIRQGTVAVNSAAAVGLNKPATITLYGINTPNPVIMKSAAFNAGPYSECTTCTLVSNVNGVVTFTVTGFSTYTVQEQQSAAIAVAEVFFDQAPRGENVTLAVTIRNSGTNENLTNLRAELLNVASKYNAQMTAVQPATLAPGASATMQLTLSIPAEEAGNKHSIGSLRVSSDQDQETVPIFIQPKSFLTINKIEVNGKTGGDLELNQVNEITVEVGNEYNQEIEDITVTVKILDVDGEDLEEESDTFDLDDGDEEEVTLNFDLAGEDLEDENYVIEVTVEGTAKDDDTDHVVTEELRADIEREKHQITITKSEVSSNSLQCNRQATLFITVENTGKTDEDDVEVTAVNAALGLNSRKSGIELDKFSDSDNEQKLSFNINAENVAPGEYPITVSAYRDSTLEDTAEVKITVQSCATPRSVTQSQNQLVEDEDELARLLQQQLQQRAATQKQPEIAQTSFRDSTMYITLLGILGVLLFLALVLSLGVLVSKKGRKPQQVSRKR